MLCMHFIPVHHVVVCRQIFCDFGNDFTVSDTDGEQPASVMIAAITSVILTLLTEKFQRKIFNQLR